MPVVELDEDPGPGFLRAALGLLPGVRRENALPDVSLIRRDVTVDRDHLAEYDRVCGFRLSDTVPVTYPHLLGFGMAMRLMSESGFPFPVVGLVHIANRITVRRPIGADEHLDIVVRSENLRSHKRGRQFDIVATATAGGVEVWRGVSTYLRKESVSEGASRKGGDGTAYGSKGQKETPRESAAEPQGTARWRIPRRVGTDYAAVSGDRNPIHTSRVGARVFGFARPIAHGMWSKARCLAAMEGRLPGACTVEVTFTAPILLPASVWFGAWETIDGWEFGLHGRRAHLAGQVTHP